jgi:hypothetical protein
MRDKLTQLFSLAEAPHLRLGGLEKLVQLRFQLVHLGLLRTRENLSRGSRRRLLRLLWCLVWSVVWWCGGLWCGGVVVCGVVCVRSVRAGGDPFKKRCHNIKEHLENDFKSERAKHKE